MDGRDLNNVFSRRDNFMFIMLIPRRRMNEAIIGLVLVTLILGTMIYLLTR